MKSINFNNKVFYLLENSKGGKVNSETRFEYKQDGSLVTADYFGGTIKYGKIIATLKVKKLVMLYQCVTIDNELKAGKATADITFNENDKMLLSIKWQWLDSDKSGFSEYCEI